MIGPARKRPLISNSPIPNRKFEDESSPTKASILLKSDSSEYISGLKAKKQNFSTSLGLYTTCHSNELPQKCLKHLNFITLYCGEDKQLLCVNCLYGNTAHKSHSVTPSNSSISQIKKDNEANLQQLDSVMKQIKESESKIIDNKKLIQSQKSFILKQIAKEFTQIRKMVDERQRQLKLRAEREFQKAEQENQITRKEVQWWRQEMNKMRSGLPRGGSTYEDEIYKHLALKLMLNDKLQTEKITYVASKDQMEHEFLNEARELKETVKNKIQEGTRSNQLKLF